MEKYINNRDITVDIVKGIGLVLMVMGHCGFRYSSFIYLFHMPLFFLISGYLFDEKKVTSFQKLVIFIKRKIISLWLPYVAYNMLFHICHNLFVQIGVYTNVQVACDSVNIVLHEKLTIGQWIFGAIKIIMFLHEPQLGGALWFLRDLFLANITFGIVYFVLNCLKCNCKIKWLLSSVIAFGSACAGYMLSLNENLLYGLAPAISSYSLMFLGVVLKRVDLSKIHTKYVGIILSTVMLLIMNKIGRVELVMNRYVNPMFLWVAVFCGWMLLYGIACRIKKINFLSRVLITINKNAICIMAMHFLCFKIVSLLQVYIYNMPSYMLASFPTTNIKGFWWVVYSFVGVICPVFLQWTIGRIKQSVRKRFLK